MLVSLRLSQRWFAPASTVTILALTFGTFAFYLKRQAIPVFSLYAALLLVSCTLLCLLEALQMSLLKLQEKFYADHEKSPEDQTNLKRFVLGRQAMATSLVFFLTQLTTLSYEAVALMFMCGWVLPRWSGSFYPMEIYHLRGMSLLHSFCLRIASTDPWSSVLKSPKMTLARRPRPQNTHMKMEKNIVPDINDYHNIVPWKKLFNTSEPSPQQVAKYLQSQRVTVPKYLESPFHPEHIPPHLIAFQIMLKLKAQQKMSTKNVSIPVGSTLQYPDIETEKNPVVRTPAKSTSAISVPPPPPSPPSPPTPLSPSPSKGMKSMATRKRTPKRAGKRRPGLRRSPSSATSPGATPIKTSKKKKNVKKQKTIREKKNTTKESDSRKCDKLMISWFVGCLKLCSRAVVVLLFGYICTVAMVGVLARSESQWVENFTFYGNYCGPGNGQNYNLPALDSLDGLCMKHDQCIEHSFPGQKIPLRSHTKSDYGCVIRRCDLEFLSELETTVDCDGGKWCRAFSWASRWYHQEKVITTREAFDKDPSSWPADCFSTPN